MFTWICPKCGKEVPPAYSECPNCAAAGKEPETVEKPAAAAPPPSVVEQPATAAPAPPAPAVRSGRVSLPGWVLSLLVAAALIIIGLTVVVLRESRRAAPAQQAAAPLENVTPAAPLANPALRNLELTGLRLTEDTKQAAFVQFVAVNHSQADLGDVTVKANLKAIAKQAQEPVGTFTFKTTLGPYESKDLKVPLETKLRVYELPDWQFLRAEILP
jgi:hypothetical protein